VHAYAIEGKSVCKTGLHRKSDINCTRHICCPRISCDAQRDDRVQSGKHSSDNKKATVEVACVCLTAKLTQFRSCGGGGSCS
jgi:hypothetical protein